MHVHSFQSYGKLKVIPWLSQKQLICPVCVCHHCTNRGHWETTIIYQRCLHLGVVSLDKSPLFKECRIVIFNWQVIPRHMFVQPLIDKVFKLPSQDSIEQWFCLTWSFSSSLWLQWKSNNLTKVEKGLGNISSTGFCFIIFTSKSVWQLRGGGGWGWALVRLLLEGCYGYLLVPPLVHVAKHPCHHFSTYWFPS